MLVRSLGAAAALVALAALVPGHAPVADACCTAFGPDARVRIADQEVLITYDPDTQTEHFVRSAAFRPERLLAEQHFGFLVPTPTQPTLAEADAGVFDRLRDAIKPRVVEVIEYQLEPFVTLATLAAPGADARAAAAPESIPSARGLEPAVRVLDRAQVAGYDAVVLEAKDAAALTDWLGDNGYAARPELTEWAEPYVAAGWMVTAFKYAPQGEGRGDVSTKAVRLSFKTDRPLFPFRVPADTIAPAGRGTLLRLFSVGPARGTGTLGEAGAAGWAAETKFAAPAAEVAAAAPDLPTLLEGAVPADDLPADAWLTAFEDRTWPSGTDDLYFTSQPDAEAEIPVIKRTKVVKVPLFLDVLAVLALGAFGVRRLVRGKQPRGA